jgi:predicted ATPase
MRIGILFDFVTTSDDSAHAIHKALLFRRRNLVTHRWRAGGSAVSTRRLHQILRSFRLERDRVPDWNAYPFALPAVRNLDEIEFAPGVTFFVGENGSGKSTLIEAIAIAAGFNPEGGNKNFTTTHRPSESALKDYVRLVRGVRRERAGFFLRAETMFNVSTEAEQYREYGWDDLHEKSHGEAFLWVIMNRFRASGLYLLDEPEAALSPQRQLTLLGRMHELVKLQSQFIIATHSPILMAYPGARILLLDPDGIRDVRYEETDHYMVTKAFLMNPRRVLDEIIGAMESTTEE